MSRPRPSRAGGGQHFHLHGADHSGIAGTPDPAGDRGAADHSGGGESLSLSLGRVVLRPLRVLATVAQQIGQGDFAVRVPVRQHDEIGTLATAVNQMAVHLQQSYTELEHKAATHAAMATENAALYRQVRQQAEVLEARSPPAPRSSRRRTATNRSSWPTSAMNCVPR